MVSHKITVFIGPPCIFVKQFRQCSEAPCGFRELRIEVTSNHIIITSILVNNLTNYTQNIHQSRVVFLAIIIIWQVHINRKYVTP